MNQLLTLNASIATKVVCRNVSEISLENSVDPDHTAPICSGSTLFASILNSSVMLGNYLQLFAADNISRRHFQMHFFLGPLRVNTTCLWDLGAG